MEATENIKKEYLEFSDDQWNNDTIIEFLQLLESEPAIWDPKHKHHRNRFRLSDAWNRIKDKFSLPCTMEAIKRKRNSLMSTYREIIRKIKVSRMNDEVYEPTWFAFDIMESFLGAVYNSSLAEEKTVSKRPRYPTNSYIITVDPKRKRTESRDSNQGETYIIMDDSESSMNSDAPGQHDEEEGSIVEERLSITENVENECDLYGQLIAEKLKQLDEGDRLTLMNEIDNFLYKYKMKMRSNRL